MCEVIAVDIGNSRLKIRGENFPLISVDYREDEIFSFPVHGVTKEILLSVSSVIEQDKTIHLIHQLMGAIPPDNYRYKIWSTQEILKDVLPQQYRMLGHLGCDRALNIYYLLKFPDTINALSFNCGTAFTIAGIKNRQFAESKILPGLRLQLESLHENTGKLPLITEELVAGILRDKNTLATDYAMVGGIIESYCQLIIATIKTLDDPEIICSGSYAPLINQVLKKHAITVRYFENLETEMLLDLGNQLVSSPTAIESNIQYCFPD